MTIKIVDVEPKVVEPSSSTPVAMRNRKRVQADANAARHGAANVTYAVGFEKLVVLTYRLYVNCPQIAF